jgi:hypothetical protein
MIKGFKPPKNSRFKNGEYKPLYESKYMGQYPIYYRSGWEYKFCLMCDNNDNIIKWASEPVEIKYMSLLDNKVHRYYPDFIITVKIEDSIKSYLVEVKPTKDIIKPKPPRNKTKKAITSYNHSVKAYIMNVSKMRYAKEWAKENNMEFVYVTEKNWNKFLR